MLDIPSSITTVFVTREERLLFAIESGSRLWGIESKDSDYDVRAFHLQSQRQQFDYQRHPDVIEAMDGDFDFVSFDIDKAFGLLEKSNPTVLEWVQAHIVYHNTMPEWYAFRERLLEAVDYRALFHHYMSLASSHEQSLTTPGKSTYKTLFYGLRGLLSADCASRGIMPALSVTELFDQVDARHPLRALALESLDHKRSSTERHPIPAMDLPAIVATVDAAAAELRARMLVMPSHEEARRKLLLEYCVFLKSTLYAQ